MLWEHSLEEVFKEPIQDDSCFPPLAWAYAQNVPDVVLQVPNRGQQSLSWFYLATVLLKQPRRLLTFFAARASCTCCPPDPFLQSCFADKQLPDCPSNPAARLTLTEFYEVLLSSSSCLSRFLWTVAQSWLFWFLPPTWCHPQTCCKCILLHQIMVLVLLHGTGPSIYPLGTPVVTEGELAFAPLTTTS